MSTDTTSYPDTATSQDDADAGRSGLSWLQGGLVALAIAVLVVGAAFIGGRDGAGGGSQLVALYEAQDAEALAQLLVPETVPGATPEQLVGAFQQTFASGSTIASQETVEALGRRLTRITTTDQPPLTFCERPDGRILLNCRVGLATLEPTQTSGDIEIGFAGIELLPGDAQAQFVVVPTGDQGATFGRPFTLSIDGQQAAPFGEVSTLGPFGPSEPVAGEVTVEPGGAALVRFQLDEQAVQRLEAGSQVTLSFPDGEAVFEVRELETYLGN